MESSASVMARTPETTVYALHGVRFLNAGLPCARNRRFVAAGRFLAAATRPGARTPGPVPQPPLRADPAQPPAAGPPFNPGVAGTKRNARLAAFAEPVLETQRRGASLPHPCGGVGFVPMRSQFGDARSVGRAGRGRSGSRRPGCRSALRSSRLRPGPPSPAQISSARIESGGNDETRGTGPDDADRILWIGPCWSGSILVGPRGSDRLGQATKPAITNSASTASHTSRLRQTRLIASRNSGTSAAATARPCPVSAGAATPDSLR